MSEVLNAIGTMINVWVFIYSCAELGNDKINYKDKFFWLFLLLISIFIFIADGKIDGLLRIMITYLLLVTSSLKIFRFNITKSGIISFLSFFLMMISELFFSLFVTCVLGADSNDMKNNYSRGLSVSIAISSIQCFILSFDFIKIKLQNLAIKINNEKTKTILSFTVLAVFTFVILSYFVYFSNLGPLATYILIILIVVYGILVITLFREQTVKLKLENDYSATLENLSEYEKMYAREKMKSHENNNDLMIIRGLAQNKEARDYIDKILGFKDDDVTNWMEQLNRIPEGGLQGILYYKLCSMEEKKIKVSFTIGRSFHSSDYLRMDVDLQAKLCKLLGIYIDNAIDAVMNLEDKNISININNLNGYMLIKIMNNYSSGVDMHRIYEEGYTTKENGHGYGLAIANTIINEEPAITNRTSINADTFCQELKIKL